MAYATVQVNGYCPVRGVCPGFSGAVQRALGNQHALIYSYGFDKYDVGAWTGIERGELLSAAGQIRDYFGDKTPDLDVRVVQRGVLQSIYEEREVSHMRDVKGLVRGVYRVQEVAGAYLGVFLTLGLAVGRRRFLRPLRSYVGIGGIVTLGLVLVAGLVSLVGFDRLFLAFHLVSFSNDFWQLDPSRHDLIAMFPQGFFFDATMWIAGSTIAEALVLASPALVFVWRKRRTSPVDEQDARLAGAGPASPSPSSGATGRD